MEPPRSFFKTILPARCTFAEQVPHPSYPWQISIGRTVGSRSSFCESRDHMGSLVCVFCCMQRNLRVELWNENKQQPNWVWWLLDGQHGHPKFEPLAAILAQIGSALEGKTPPSATWVKTCWFAVLLAAQKSTTQQRFLDIPLIFLWWPIWQGNTQKEDTVDLTWRPLMDWFSLIFHVQHSAEFSIHTLWDDSLDFHASSKSRTRVLFETKAHIRYVHARQDPCSFFFKNKGFSELLTWWGWIHMAILYQLLYAVASDWTGTGHQNQGPLLFATSCSETCFEPKRSQKLYLCLAQALVANLLASAACDGLRLDRQDLMSSVWFSPCLWLMPLLSMFFPTPSWLLYVGGTECQARSEAQPARGELGGWVWSFQAPPWPPWPDGISRGRCGTRWREGACGDGRSAAPNEGEVGGFCSRRRIGRVWRKMGLFKTPREIYTDPHRDR